MKKISLLIILLSAFNLGFGQIVAWDMDGNLGNEISFDATTLDANLSTSTLTRGIGLDPSAFGNSFNSNSFTNGNTKSGAISDDEYLEFQVSASSGYQVSLSTLDANFRRSNAGPDSFIWRYSIDGTNFTDIGVPFSYSVNSGNGTAQAQINLTTIPTLQNVPFGTTITFRLYGWGSGSGLGNFALGRLSGNDLSLDGTVAVLGPCPTTNIWNGITSTWSNGTPPTSSEHVILDGNFTTVSGVNLFGCTLTVNAGYTLTVTNNTFVEIQNEVIVDGTIEVNPYGSFVQRNDALGAAGTTVNAGGNVRVRKETAPTVAWYEYTYWSSPVQNETIDALVETEPSRRFVFQGQNFLDHCAETANNNILVCDDGFGNGIQDGIDDNNDDWAWVPGSTTMQPGAGYVATLSEFAFNTAPGNNSKQIILSPFEGPFNNGIINVPVYRNDSELNDDNVNLIGNPYPSAIDANLFLAENMFDASTNPSGTLDGIIYLWSQNTAPSAIANGNQQLNFSDSDYAMINGATFTAGGDGITPTNIIPSGQAFFITYSNNAPHNLVSGDIFTGNVTFNNSMRTIGETDNNLFFKDSKSEKQSNNFVDNKLWLNLTSANNAVFNQMAVAYVKGATDSDDGSFYDAKKPSSIVTGAILYSNIEGSNKKFGIQAKATNSLDIHETISLGFKSNFGATTLFKLSIADLQGDFLTNNTIYLKDNLTNTIHNLSNSDYTFTTDVGEFNNRFEIVFNTNTLSTNLETPNSNKFTIVNLDNDTIQFNTNSNLSIKSIQIFDLTGRQLYNINGNKNSETVVLSSLKSTIFIAKIELSNGTVITKKALKK